MDIYDSEEWDIGDNMIYDSLHLDDLPFFLEDLGTKTRKIGVRYLSYDHYKHIFHYGLLKQYPGMEFFSNYIEGRPYISYNNIIINHKTNVLNTAMFLCDIFSLVKDKICIFVDIQGSERRNRYHTTLLIYRKLENVLEYFDSNGVGGYGFTFKLKEIVDIVLEKMNGLKIVKSKELNGLTGFSNIEASRRSLNGISNISKPKSVGGWCQIWSLFLYELIYKYPNETTKDLIRVLYSIFDFFKNKTPSVVLNNLIKGYYRIIIGKINLVLSKEDLPNLYITSEILTEYKPNLVINDRNMENVIYKNTLPHVILDSSEYCLVDEY